MGSTRTSCGGFKEGIVDENTRGCLEKAILRHDPTTSDVPYLICYATITAVRQQVVSGINYIFTLDGCGHQEHSASTKCAGDGPLELRVYVQPWTDTYKLMSLNDPEMEAIDAWLTKSNLNAFGDAVNSMYVGGTPLFDERTGKKISRKQFLVSKFLHRPWRN